MSEDELKEKMKMFGRKLRAYARWDCNPHYYATPSECTVERAKEEMAEALANMIDEAFEVDSSIGQSMNRHDC